MYVARNSSGVRPDRGNRRPGTSSRWLGRQHIRRGHVEQLRPALEEADVEVFVGLAQGEHHDRVRPHVANFWALGLLGDEDRLAVPAEPDRDEVRQPSGRTVLIHTTGSLRRRRSMRAAGASAVTWSMPASSMGAGRACDHGRPVRSTSVARRATSAPARGGRPPRPFLGLGRLGVRGGGPRRGLGVAADRVRRRPIPRPEPLQQPPAGEVEVDRRDRDPPVDDGVEVRPLDREPRRRRAADPEVGDAARVDPLDQLVLVDAPAKTGHLETLALLRRRPRAH